MNRKIFSTSVVAVILLSGAGVVLAQALNDTKSVRNDDGGVDRPVAIILPADGRLADQSGKLHQSLALECISGKPDGISCASPENGLNVAINASVTIEVSVDENAPVSFSAVRKVNHTFPDGLTSRADDAESTLRLIRNLETANEVICVNVTNPVNGRTEAFTLKANK